MRWFLIVVLAGCVMQPPPGEPMSATYTATPDAIVSGGAVQQTEPVDGDALTALSNNLPDRKQANILKKLVDQALLTGMTPGILDSHSQGLLHASEVDGNGARMRIYSMYEFAAVGGGASREMIITVNAAWNAATTKWDRDTDNVAAVRYRLASETGLGVQGLGGFKVEYFDCKAGSGATASWNEGDWYKNLLTNGGTLQGPGVGIIPLPDELEYANAAMANSWVNDTDTAGNRMRLWKDVFGVVHLWAYIKNGVGLSVLSSPLSAAYRPAFKRMFPVVCPDGASPQAGYLTVNTSGVIEVQLAPSRSSALIYASWR